MSGFIYYKETEPFARRNILNILECLWAFEDEMGEPLKKDANKLNWLAWFALEHIIDKIIVYKESNNSQSEAGRETGPHARKVK